MNPRIVLLVTVFLATGAFADDAAERAKLVGVWQPQDPAAKDAGVWTLEAKGENLRVAHSIGDQTVTEFECNTTGRECEVKDAQKKAKISMYFNGSKLVVLETKGHDIVKRQFSVVPQDDTLEVEIIPVVPDGKTETLRYHRAQH
jgi:hypothetical protein